MHVNDFIVLGRLVLGSIISGGKESIEISLIDVPGDVLATEATRVKPFGGGITYLGRLDKVIKRLIEQPIASNDLIDLLN